MPLKSLFNGSKKRKAPPRKTKEKDVPSMREEKKATRFMPADPDAQKIIAHLLIQWSKEPASIDMDIFFSQRDVGHYNFYTACKTNPYLDECYNIALQNVGLNLKQPVKESFEYCMKEYPKYDTLSRIERKERLEANKTPDLSGKVDVTVIRG